MPKTTAWRAPALLRDLTHASPGAAFQLSDIDPADERLCSGDKPADKQRVEALAIELDEWQNLLFADKRHALLVVLQGMDASGKDGTLRGVFSRMSPLGVRTVAWKAPNEEERAHDPLWRIHRAVPAKGEVVVFNRSHYEDVLVPVVERTVTDTERLQRYARINDFERSLCETGTVVCKFMLHISKAEQRQRLQERLDDPTKRWKFDPHDLDVRRRWAAYQRAYDAAIRATGTPWAPWTIVPADSKTHRNLVVATVLLHRLKAMGLRYPPLPDALKGIAVR
ncbi:PPK2 family polyphosphate kinase [Aquincola sp. MAHUQ-54]|uniref:PPK2 family polyphosphate kinase n=1 Tax=Aquincola agrisoli TaxID=3119538 RepID=A0AAW9Q958_9BURK